MNCPKTKDLLHAYLDGELSLTEQLDYERHLSACADCRGVLQSMQLLRQKLNDHQLRYELPDALRRQMRKAAVVHERPWRIILPRVVSVAAVIAIIVLGGATLWLARTHGQSLERDLVDAHIRSLQADHLTDVTSTNQHTVKPWFDGKLDFAPPVVNPASQGFPLIGGRLDYLDGHPAAVLVYRHDKHLINLFVWPRKGADQAPQESAINGYNIVQWRRNGMQEAAVSDLEVAQMRQLVNLLR